MNHTFFYQEITCLPDHEISVGFVMGKVMDVLHLGLVNVAGGTSECPVGLSFPEYRDERAEAKPGRADAEHQPIVPIGSKIRVFSRQENDLQRLGLTSTLARLSDYVHFTSVRLLERKVDRYAIYKRCQPKSSKERLIRRQMKRKGISEFEARKLYESFEPRYSQLPYVNMCSHSTGERFRLYVERQFADLSDQWSFSTYGLSGKIAVPEF